MAVAFLLLWEAIVRLLDVPKFIAPSPVDVVQSIWLGFKSGLFGWERKVLDSPSEGRYEKAFAPSVSTQ